MIIFSIKETEKVRVFIISPLKYQVSFLAKTYFHMLKDHHCYGYKDLHVSQVKKKTTKYESEMVCFFFGVKHYMATWRYEISLLLVLKITLCISLDCKHSKRNFVPSHYHIISSMHLGHEDIYSEKLTIFLSSLTIRVTRGSCILQFCYYKV